MATRADILADVDNLCGNDPQLSDTEINTHIQLRYEEIYETFLWSKSLREFTLTLVAQTSSASTNTVTATLGDGTVTSAGTPFTSGMAGRSIQIGSEPQRFEIDTFTSTAEIELGDGESAAATWPRATASSLTWRVFQTLYALPSTGDTLVSLSGDFPLEELDGGRSMLDTIDPDRSTSSDHPTSWCYAGVTSTAARRIEVWPVPTQARILRGQMGRSAPTLVGTTTIDLNRGLLVYATTADCLNMLYAKTGDESYQKLALFYERKYGEVERDIKPKELEKLSPPTSIRRWRGVQLSRGDWAVDHDPEVFGVGR